MPRGARPVSCAGTNAAWIDTDRPCTRAATPGAPGPRCVGCTGQLRHVGGRRHKAQQQSMVFSVVSRAAATGSDMLYLCSLHWKWPLPSPYFPCVCRRAGASPAVRPITVPRSPLACGSSQQRAAETRALLVYTIWAAAKINVSPTDGSRLCRHAGMQQRTNIYLVYRLARACCLQHRATGLTLLGQHQICLVPRFPRHHATPCSAGALCRLRYDFTVNLISRPVQASRGIWH